MTDFSRRCVVTLKRGEILVEVKSPFLLACDHCYKFHLYISSFLSGFWGSSSAHQFFSLTFSDSEHFESMPESAY